MGEIIGSRSVGAAGFLKLWGFGVEGLGNPGLKI